MQAQLPEPTAVTGPSRRGGVSPGELVAVDG
jgi:hypothetical protein